MGIDVAQLRDVVVIPTLTVLGLHSPSAVNLVLGTAAQETQLGKFLVQQGIGFKGGIGIYQCQKNAYDNVWSIILADNLLKIKMKNLLGFDGKPPAERMATDLLLATAICRLYYFNIKAPLPAPDDIVGLAQYWKDYWNTRAGKGTTQEFTQHYHDYVMS